MSTPALILTPITTGMGTLAAALCELLPTGWGDEPHAVSPPETLQLLVLEGVPITILLMEAAVIDVLVVVVVTRLVVLGTVVVCVATGGQLPDERDKNHVSAILALYFHTAMVLCASYPE